MSIGFDVEQRAETTVLRVAGFVDAHTAPELERRLRQLMDTGHHWIVLDLAGLSYISSAGLGVFMAVIEDLRTAGGDLLVASLDEDVRLVYEMLGFHTVFRTFEDVDAAVASVHGA